MKRGLIYIDTACVTLAIMFALLGCVPKSTNPSNTTAIILPLTLQIISPINGQVVSSNVLKVRGTVSYPAATILVNDIRAKVDSQGRFYRYIEMIEGENKIEVTAIQADQVKRSEINAIFNAPLAVFLDPPNPEEDADYRQIPLILKGYVSRREASIEINRIPAEVNEDGHYAAEIQLMEGNNEIRITGSLGEKTDVFSQNIIVKSDGKLFYPPALNDRVPVGPGDISLKTGQTISQEFDMQLEKFVQFPTDLAQKVFRVDNKHRESTLQPAQGLNIEIEPIQFKLYPMVIYSSTITVQAEAETPPGEYFFNLERRLNNLISNASFRVIVETSQ